MIDIIKEDRPYLPWRPSKVSKFDEERLKKIYEKLKNEYYLDLFKEYFNKSNGRTFLVNRERDMYIFLSLIGINKKKTLYELCKELEITKPRITQIFQKAIRIYNNFDSWIVRILERKIYNLNQKENRLKRMLKKNDSSKSFWPLKRRDGSHDDDIDEVIEFLKDEKNLDMFVGYYLKSDKIHNKTLNRNLEMFFRLLGIKDKINASEAVIEYKITRERVRQIFFKFFRKFCNFHDYRLYKLNKPHS